MGSIALKRSGFVVCIGFLIYKIMNDHCKRENTGEIVCPHCDYEHGDSYEYIPRDSDGEVGWVMECVECEKSFDVAFDCRNVDDGYTSSIMKCKDENHNYELSDRIHKSSYTSGISIYSRIEICSICDDYKFTPVKEDGSDFTKKELLDFRLKKRLNKKPKMHLKFNGVKSGIFEIRNDIEISLKLNEPEGNINIWVKLCRHFISKGYKAQIMPDYLRKHSISFKRDWIECDVSVNNYGISVKFYQNEILIDREKGDGRYQYNQYEILTDQMKVMIRANLNMVKKYFVKSGFTLTQDLTDYQKLLKNMKITDLSDWNDPEDKYYKRDRQDRDKNQMKSGDFKYFYNRNVLQRGVIWWNNGNQWYVMCNGVLNYTSHYELFDYTNEPIKKPLNEDAKIQRLHTELKKAEKAHKYDRCKALWNLLQSQVLYNVWSLKHNAWWGKNNCGYTSEKENAGVYTYQKIMSDQSYYNDGINSVAKQIV